MVLTAVIYNFGADITVYYHLLPEGVCNHLKIAYTVQPMLTEQKIPIKTNVGYSSQNRNNDVLNLIIAWM